MLLYLQTTRYCILKVQYLQARTEGGFGRFGRTALLKKGPQFTLKVHNLHSKGPQVTLKGPQFTL